MNLKGQNILVTGASKGIGKSIAIHLLKANAQLGIHFNKSREEANKINTKYPLSETFQADLAQSDEVQLLFKNTIKHFGNLDTIILNAGVFLPHPIDEPTENWLEIWRQTMAINLEAAGLITKLGIEHFKTQGGGRIN